MDEATEMVEEETRLEQLKEELANLQGLQAHPGFAILAELVQRETDVIQAELIYSQDFSDAGRWRSVFDKGRLNGLLLVQEVLESRLEMLKTEVQHKEEQESEK